MQTFNPSAALEAGRRTPCGVGGVGPEIVPAPKSQLWQADGANYWTYYRVYQVSGGSAETLKTQYFTTATPTFVTGQSASAVNSSANTSIAATFPYVDEAW